MLRSLTEQVRVYLDPQCIVLLRMAGIFKHRIVDQLIIPIERTERQSNWELIVGLLAEQFGSVRWGHGRVRILLSGELVRFRIAAWDDRLTEEEQEALLQHQFATVYGDSSKNWQITLGDNGYGRPRLACAVDGDLLKRLQTLCKESGVRLATVRPFLMTAFNRWRNTIGLDGWMLIVEPSGLTLALVRHGKWQSVRYQRLRPGWESEIELIVAREASQHGIHPTAFPVYFFWAAHPNFNLKLPECFKTAVLRLPQAQKLDPNDKPLAWALSI